MSKSAKTPSRRKLSPQPSTVDQDPVEVFCRVRPLQEDEEDSCVEVLSDSVLQVTPPESSLSFKSGHSSVTQHTFKHVFGDSTSQKEVFDRVAMPLLEDLVKGKNGLLFTYGITNSGKTYTMTGEPDNAGILPRCLDILFNSISDVQAPRYVFKPDRTNGFEVQTESEARAEAMKHKPKKISAKARAEMPEYGDILRVPENRKCSQKADEDSNFAVFASYVEIYNNYIYDLLEDINENRADLKPKAPQSKTLREGSGRQMFISGVTEVEVKSTEEAYETLWKGQKRRRVAHTQLNAESSRSHSVFTIKLVSAPLDSAGEEVVQDKTKVIMNQLSLVDLAGSERASRTGNHGERLREANNINANLMVLRTCMETLRDNQLHCGNKIVPYRDSKLTHVFKNYFDGEGTVKMVICVSPKSEDYDETIHVMRFAEVTQEVQIDRQSVARLPVGMTPGRRRANMLYKAALKKGEEGTPPPAVHPYHLALPLLCVDRFLNAEAYSFKEFKSYLLEREKTRKKLLGESKVKETQFRDMIQGLQQENADFQAKMVTLEASLKSKDKILRENKELANLVSVKDEEISKLKESLSNMQSVIEKKDTNIKKLHVQAEDLQKRNVELQNAFDVYQNNRDQLQKELHDEKERIKREKEEKEHIKKTMKGFVHSEKEKFEKLAREKLAQDEKLSRVFKMVQNTPTSNGKDLPLCAKSHRKRSISENWLDHRPTSTLDGDTVMQPHMKKKKTVLTPKPKHFKDKHNKYMLTHQEQDTKGRMKTRLYKGEIMETRGGGTAVKFTNMEQLDARNMSKMSGSSHDSVEGSKPRRSTRLARKTRGSTSDQSIVSVSSDPGEYSNVETRCAVGIEGRPGALPAYRHIPKATAI